jgi:hypothetical protein
MVLKGFFRLKKSDIFLIALDKLLSLFWKSMELRSKGLKKPKPTSQ